MSQQRSRRVAGADMPFCRPSSRYSLQRSMHFHCGAYRVILTDLSSLNGTWVNRAKLRPHADSQIQAQDVIAFGSSDATFQLVALDASTSSLPSALEVAEVMLEGAWHLPNQLDSATTQHPDGKLDILSQWRLHAARYREATSRADQWKHLLQASCITNARHSWVALWSCIIMLAQYACASTMAAVFR